MDMNIGEQIRRRREELGLSQAELAKRIGVTQGSIGNYESGVSNPKMELMTKLFEALDTDANYLFHEALDIQRMSFTYQESEMIRKYRTLDQYGQDAVTAVLDVECRRCAAQTNEPKLIKVRQAARNGGAPSVTMMTQSELDEIENLPDADPDL